SQSGSGEQKSKQNSVDETKSVNKLRMLLNAVEKVEAEERQQQIPEMPDWMENAPVIWRREKK
ncbi:MAG: hypothetical protein K2H61_01185, partial [Muribaculaceae bacterium]|nr:hypothetical protein [Muribaculaceae bacterium]